MTGTHAAARPGTTPRDPAAAHRFVTGDGTALHVRTDGFGNPGPTLVLVHGWTLDHTSWDPVVAALPPGARVLRFDHRGHGGSAPAPRGTATIARIADDLAELIADRVPAGPLVLAGHSMGGMALMALAEQHPELVADRVRGAAFVATSAGGLSDLTLGLPKWLAVRVANTERALNRRLAGLDRPALLRRPAVARPGLRWLLFGAHPRRIDVIATAAQVGRCHPASMAGFRDSLNQHSRRAALASFGSVPSVVLAGGADRLCPVPHARVIAAELPGADFVTYPKAGHMLPCERPAEVAAHLARLLTRVRP